MPGAVREKDLEAARQVDAATQALVPTCQLGKLPTDPKHLETLFLLSTTYWKTYSGEKPSGDRLARINAVYKQATLGDCPDTEDWSTPFEKAVLTRWRSLRGTVSLTAKRRFLGLLRDVDPRLLQVKAYHFIPWGFPTTAKGDRICPYSNAKKGCPRPLMDKYGHNVEHELDFNESLLDFVKLRKWLDEVAVQQRCTLGLHTPIKAHMGSNFATFFARPECGGFKPYTSTGLHELVKKKQLLAMVEMQNNPRNLSSAAQLRQRDRLLGLQQYYTSITGHEITNEIPCSRDSHHCNTRRLAEGGNHSHPLVIRAPPTDLTFYESLIQVRRECVRLGVAPMTGPVNSIDHRYRLLQMKVVDFHREKMQVYESQRRQQWRTDIATHDAAMLKAFSRFHQSDCLRNALKMKDMNRVCVVLESGADASTELQGGIFPLMAAVLKRSVPNIRRLLAAGADIDTNNSRGMTALMWAVKRDDYAMVDALLEEGADVGVEGCSGWTAMSIASRHGRSDIAQLLVEILRRDKIAGEMNADRVLNHRSNLNGGLPPVAIAAIHRNEAMVRCLMRLGANPSVKCHRGYVAGEHAANLGWTALGLWLQETRAFGANGVYTLADINAENALRSAGVRMLDAISSGATVEEGMEKSPRKQASAINFEAGKPETEVPTSHQNSKFAGVTDIQLKQVQSNTTLTVKVLQEGHAAPDAETDGGHTALISAAYQGLASCVRLLIQEGADPNYSNRNDRTALMAAAARGHQKVLVALLHHGADAAWLDRDGKIAGAYAFERGFCQLAELLAIASSQGNKAALEWELDRRRRDEEDMQRRRVQNLLDGARGGEKNIPEAALHDWLIRVTKPREAARLADMKEVAQQNMASLGSDVHTKTKNSGKTPPIPQDPTTQGKRCPKCTLIVPCLHFTSSERLRAEFPDGIPEWEWKKRGLNRRASPERGDPLAKVRNVKDGVQGSNEGVVWWRGMYQAHRDRALPPRGITSHEAGIA